MDLTEAGLRAVHSSLVTASSSSSEDHKVTHAILSQCQGQLQQIVRKHVTFETVENVVRSSTLRARVSNPIAKTTVFWKSYHYRLPIGMLTMRLCKSRQSSNSSRSTSQICTESDIALEFVPPRWLSRVAVAYSMKLDHDLISHQWHWGASLKTPTVNYNPLFRNAVMTLDADGVRRSFAEGLAQPTDYMINWDGSPRPWYEVRLESIGNCDVLNLSRSPQ